MTMLWVVYVFLGVSLAAGQGYNKDDFLITVANSTLPWNNGTSVKTGPSKVADFSASFVTFAACTYREAHWHATADELWVQLSGSAETHIVAPNNTDFVNLLKPKDAIVYPKGWLHYQFNPQCTPFEAVVSFNFKTAGTVDTLYNLAALPASYLQSAYGLKDADDVRKPIAKWVVNCACIKACGLTDAACN